MIAPRCTRIALSPAPFVVVSAILFCMYEWFIVFFFGSAVMQAFFLFFFRDAQRPVGEGIVSPADGRVLSIDNNRVSIFMSLFDLHVNLVPYGGTVLSMRHYPGQHKPAYGEATNNEQLVTEVASPLGRIEIVQIAGIVARRIVPYVGESDVLRKGDKLGIIRFGSRVDLGLPEGAKIVVAPGETVRAGETVAVWQGHEPMSQPRPPE
jgi:phosphatidylserine decarboxylase